MSQSKSRLLVDLILDQEGFQPTQEVLDHLALAVAAEIKNIESNNIDSVKSVRIASKSNSAEVDV